jgi:aspartyl-tRNA(Asn)/glutamyl-tRNA(Gln) amidotransferase subunit B
MINELFARLNKEGQVDVTTSPGQRGNQLGGIVDACRLGRDLGQDGQGPVRDRLDRGRRPGCGSSRRAASSRSPTWAPSRRSSTRSSPPTPTRSQKVLAKPTMIGWFVGQAMKASGGKANPQALNELMKKKLGLE